MQLALVARKCELVNGYGRLKGKEMSAERKRMMSEKVSGNSESLTHGHAPRVNRNHAYRNTAQLVTVTFRDGFKDGAPKKIKGATVTDREIPRWSPNTR